MDTTSLEAYAAVKPTIHATHQRVLDVLAAGPATHSELRERDDHLRTYVNLHTRLGEMHRLGVIVKTNNSRKNTRGRSERVLALA